MIQCLDELQSSQSFHLDLLIQPVVPQQQLQDLLVPDGHSHVERCQSSPFLQVTICPLVCQKKSHHGAGGLGNSEGQGGESIISLNCNFCEETLSPGRRGGAIIILFRKITISLGPNLCWTSDQSVKSAYSVGKLEFFHNQVVVQSLRAHFSKK